MIDESKHDRGEPESFIHTGNHEHIQNTELLQNRFLHL